MSSNSWFGAWIGLEINLISFIPLMSNVKHKYNTEASLKYFTVQMVCSNTSVHSSDKDVNRGPIYIRKKHVYSNNHLYPSPALLPEEHKSTWCSSRTHVNSCIRQSTPRRVNNSRSEKSKSGSSSMEPGRWMTTLSARGQEKHTLRPGSGVGTS